jgi:hypothetical protein
MTVSPIPLGLPSRTAPKLGTDVGNEPICANAIVASFPLAEALPRFAKRGTSCDLDAGR